MFEMARLSRFFVLGSILFSVAGCADPGVINQRAAKFSAALATTTANVREGFASANRAHANAEIEALTYDYQSGRIVRPRFEPFISAEQLALRMTVLEGLEAYAAKLLALTGADPKAQVGEAIDGVSAKLVALDLTQIGLSRIPQGTVDQASAAVKRIGAFLIDQELGRKLPALTKEMHRNVANAASLLIADIGEEPTSGTLRGQLRLAYTSYAQSHAQNLIKAQELKTIGFAEYRNLVRDLVAVNGQAQAADAAMAATVVALRQLVDTHSKLEKIADEGRETDVMIERLSRAARDIRDIHRLVLAAVGQS